MSDIKKSSYYVLFLGAKESKGLRGMGFVDPVLQYFVTREQRMQALKVTLQVSAKGLKIIPTTSAITGAQGQGQDAPCEKHFIPHHAITCVFQAPPPNDDIVSCIHLIYNPSTKCPVHVHCYRCDSPETAEILREQLETLVNREENQKKFREIESRLQSKGLLLPEARGRDTPDFDCRNSESSENSDRGFGSGGSGASNLTSDRIANLYDSLAAELREKLNSRRRNTPILLPPKDYDTVNRQRGNLSGIESKRCLNPAIVGGAQGAPGHRHRQSYASSGIGSTEENVSPIQDPLLENVPSSSDDEEWSPSQVVAATESSQYLVRPLWPTKLPSPIPPPLPKRSELRQRSPDVPSPPTIPAVFSRERFEGVRQKWEKLNHQYRRSHDSLDDGYRSREAAEADYRRQLSRESLLRSLSRSKGSRDSLDRWVENGVRNRDGPSVLQQRQSSQICTNPNATKGLAAKPQLKIKSQEAVKVGYKRMVDAHPMSRKEISYRELKGEQRLPGLDKETARTLHSSQMNLSHHIYSEPAFERPPPLPTKSKKFSFAFWK